MAVPDYAKLSKFEDINYLCNIRDEKDFNVKFVREKVVIILQNCFTDKVDKVYSSMGAGILVIQT